MGLTWLGVRRLVVRSGAGAVVLAARARPPRPGDVEERQLVNLVDELALAAGVPPPRVMLLDGRLVNAAVVGRSIDDATLLFPRRMLDDLGRGPTGAVVADLLAVVVNGDLRIALVISSVFHTFDLVAAALAAPFHRETRAALWQLCRLAARRRSRRDDGEAQFVAETLARAGADPWAGDEDGDGESKGGCWNAGLQLPFFFASLAYTITRLIVDFVLVVPLMSALWRRRRLLADATALELTRDPVSLARAFDYLAAHGNSIAGPWTHLFVVGPEVAHERAQRWRERREAGAVCDRTDVVVDLPRDPTDDLGPSFGGGHDLDGFLPPLRKRRERLAAMAMGEVASVEAVDAVARRPRPRLQPRRWPGLLAGTLAVCVLLLVVAGLLLVVLGLAVYLMLFFQLIVLLPPVLLVHALLR